MTGGAKRGDVRDYHTAVSSNQSPQRSRVEALNEPTEAREEQSHQHNGDTRPSKALIYQHTMGMPQRQPSMSLHPCEAREMDLLPAMVGVCSRVTWRAGGQRWAHD